MHDNTERRNDADKKVLIIENFHYLLKGDTLVFAGTDPFLKETQEVTVSDPTTYASGWVENSMISKIGNLAFSVSGFLKVKELPFSVMRRIFPDGTLQERIELYAVLGENAGIMETVGSVSICGGESDDSFREKQLSSGTDDQMAVGGIA